MFLCLFLSSANLPLTCQFFIFSKSFNVALSSRNRHLTGFDISSIHFNHASSTISISTIVINLDSILCSHNANLLTNHSLDFFTIECHIVILLGSLQYTSEREKGTVPCAHVRLEQSRTLSIVSRHKESINQFQKLFNNIHTHLHWSIQHSVLYQEIHHSQMHS